MEKDKKIKNESELENIDGGSTWDPVDEKCPRYNSPDGCPSIHERGFYSHCKKCNNY